jgi:hypothetical protein
MIGGDRTGFEEAGLLGLKDAALSLETGSSAKSSRYLSWKWDLFGNA